MKKEVSIVLFLLFLHLTAKAVEVKVDHVFYNADSDTQTAEVIRAEAGYEGPITIPEEFTAWSKSYRVISIADNAFRGNSGITSVSIAESVTSIGGAAFCDCKSLIAADLPESVKLIGRDAFKRCTSLPSIKLSSNLETIDIGAFGSCESLTSVVIPNGVTTLGSSAFYGCLALITIDFPESVASLGTYGVIDYCPAMTDCYFHHTTPLNITAETFHESTRQQLTLHVPSGCKAQYATAEYWKDFKEIIDDIPTTGILPVLTKQDAESYYDLQGNRLDKTRLPQNSIVIHHGKKYVVK